MVKLNKRLNLALEVETPDGGRAYVYSTPISEEVFDSHFMTISKAFAAIANEGLGTTAGPRVAMRLVRRIAEQDGVWEGPHGVNVGLVQEIRRLTMVSVQTASGWDQMPLDQAARSNALDEEAVRAIENQIMFFILVSSMLEGKRREAVLDVLGLQWGMHFTPLSLTEWIGSSPTSTVTATSQDTEKGPEPPAGASLAPC